MMNEALFSSKNMNWCTPPDFFKELDREFHFDLDAAATDKSAKCRNYFTPADDGLSKDWGGHSVFWLIPARTDTSYYHDYIFHGKADEVRFIRGRLKFTDEDGNAGDSAPFPSAVIVWRSPDRKRKNT
jgi:site-specific DNA-methyltransferase (adenine-specific)